jgi:hypothetical protein
MEICKFGHLQKTKINMYKYSRIHNVHFNWRSREEMVRFLGKRPHTTWQTTESPDNCPNSPYREWTFERYVEHDRL